jgi:hypothetical protein
VGGLDAYVEFVGYAPRFLADDFTALLQNNAAQVQLSVLKVNRKAPEQMKLLCKFECVWPAGFQALAHKIFQHTEHI